MGQKQLLAQRPLAGRRGKVEGRKTSLVFLVDFGSGLNELTNYHVLPVVAGQVKRGIAVAVDLVDLSGEDRIRFIRFRVTTRSVLARAFARTDINPQAQQVMHRAAHAAGRGGVERRVGLLVLAVNLRSTGHQQLHHLQVA